MSNMITWLLFLLIIATIPFLVNWLVPRLIYPAPSISVGNPPAGLEEIKLPQSTGENVYGWLYRKPAATDSTPVVLFLHGNGENLQTMNLGGLFEALQHLDVHYLALEYPGYGKSGGKPSEKSILEAGNSAIDWLVSQFPKNPKVLLGWSLGAGAAFQIANQQGDRVDGLIVLSPWSSLPEAAAAHYPEWLVGLVLKEKYNSVEAAKQIHCPTLVIHGETDTIIPVSQSEKIAASLRGTVRYMRMTDAGHNDLFAQEEVWQQLYHYLHNFTRADYGKPPADAEFQKMDE